MKIVGRRIQKKKRAQSIPKAVLKLAKSEQDRFDYIALETVENDTDIITGDVEDDINIGLDWDLQKLSVPCLGGTN